METETTNPMAQEEKQMTAMVSRIKDLEQQLRDKEQLVDRLRDLIRKCYSDSFPPELKCESERKY